MDETAEFGRASGVQPSVLDVPEAARLLGVGRTLAYQLVRTGRWPTPIIRVGRLIKVPTEPLLRFLATGGSGTA
jgi:excisionase family DNA binding protein